MERLAIVAGAGQFPYLVAKEAKYQGYYVVVCPVIGHATEDFTEIADCVLPIHIGKLNENISLLHTHKIKLFCAAGAINKRKAFTGLPDFRMTKLLFSSLAKGDDSLLRNILQEIEKEGFTIVQPAHFIPSLRVPEGLLTKSPLTTDIKEQMEYGLPIIRTMGTLDIGQCIVVHNGMVIAVEAIEGTDATLERAGRLCPQGCIAIKTTKPSQDLRVDLPSIGKKTIELMIEYKYSALLVEAQRTLFFDMEESIALANKHGITIFGISI